MLALVFCGAGFKKNNIMNWINVNSELPKKHDGFGFVYCLIVVGNNPQVREAMFNTRTQRFMTRQFDDLSDAKITHWSELPELPSDGN